MKRRISFIVLLVVLAVFSTGCDFIRASLGKPTSKDLVKISDELKAREQYLRDSVAAVRAAQTGETVASAQPAQPGASASAVQPTQAQPAPASVSSGNQPLKRYYAVAGAFKNPEGAQQYVDKLQARNLSVHIFDFKSGLKVVCLEGHDSLQEAQQDVATLKELQLSDSDPWIYNTKQNLHK
jgi:cell division septation protein DedD